MITTANERTMIENMMNGCTAVLRICNRVVAASYYKTHSDECIIVLEDETACVECKFYASQVKDIWEAFFNAFRTYDLIEIAD